MPRTATACPLDCPDTCGVLVETDAAGGFVRLRGNPEHSYSRGSLCGKTAIFGELLDAENRLRQPLLRKPDGDWKCAICLAQSAPLANDRRRSRLGCGHEFHTQCAPRTC